MRWLRHPPRWFWVLLIVCAIELLYVYIITAGTFIQWPTWNANYNLQAEGFRAGHLYLKVLPSPELLALRNPYDHANVNLWFWDASLYKRHYYLYWGPFPALVIAAIKTIFRIDAEIGDQYPLFVCYTLLLGAGALLLDLMARRLYPRLPLPLVLLSIVLFGLANPTPYMIATPGIYEAAIVAAQAFMVLGLLFAFDAIWKAGGGVTPRGRLLAAGISWGIAIACRPTAGPTAFVCWLATLIVVSRREGLGLRRDWRRLFRDTVWMAGPVVVFVAMLLAYNRARFDRWLEFGVTYQLNNVPFLTGPQFVASNLYSYLLRPVSLSCRFPFVSALREIGARGFPTGWTLPPRYSTGEPLAGILVTAPWTWLVFAAPVAAVVGAVRAFRARALDARGWLVAWCFAVMASLAVVSGLTFLPAYTTTMRYLADVSTGIVLLSIWAAWVIYEGVRARAWARWLLIVIYVGLALLTVGLGVLLGFQGYDDMFKNHNPALYRLFVKSLSVCGGR